MTREEKKAAVLAECERLCPDSGSIHKFSEDLYLRNSNHSGDHAAWWDCFAIEYQNHRPVFTVSTVGITNEWNFEVAYLLLGLDKPPADTKWERLKAWLEDTREWVAKQDQDMDWTPEIYMVETMPKIISNIEKGEL